MYKNVFKFITHQINTKTTIYRSYCSLDRLNRRQGEKRKNVQN